jgi:hypothetical protein
MLTKPTAATQCLVRPVVEVEWEPGDHCQLTSWTTNGASKSYLQTGYKNETKLSAANNTRDKENTCTNTTINCSRKTLSCRRPPYPLMKRTSRRTIMIRITMGISSPKLYNSYHPVFRRMYTATYYDKRVHGTTRTLRIQLCIGVNLMITKVKNVTDSKSFSLSSNSAYFM